MNIENFRRERLVNGLKNALKYDEIDNFYSGRACLRVLEYDQYNDRLTVNFEILEDFLINHAPARIEYPEFWDDGNGRQGLRYTDNNGYQFEQYGDIVAYPHDMTGEIHAGYFIDSNGEVIQFKIRMEEFK
jgi:hypothetical protein